jgi:hypothetical protein
MFHLQNTNNLFFLIAFLKGSAQKIIADVMRYSGTIELTMISWKGARNFGSHETHPVQHCLLPPVPLPLSPRGQTADLAPCARV